MFEIKYHLPLYERLKPVKEWRDKQFTDAQYYTLEKAAKLASERTGKEIAISDFLDAASKCQIRLLVILPRTAKLEKYDGGIYCNGGTANENIVPEGAMPYLPLTACQHLYGIGKASWRTFDGFEEAGGIMYRFTEAMLIDGEPDFETVPEDCRIYGREIHALADYLAPLAPVVPPVTTLPSTSEAVAPAWQAPGLPQRNAGYSMALYSALKAAHSAGLPIPTAREVLEWWRNNPYPAEIEEVLTDEFKHYGTKNSTKAVNLRNLQKAINRMASARLMAP